MTKKKTQKQKSDYLFDTVNLEKNPPKGEVFRILDGSRSKKKQGYKSREDESLGMRTGKQSTKKQSKRARRDESYGAWGKRKMTLGRKNKVNK